MCLPHEVEQQIRALAERVRDYCREDPLTQASKAISAAVELYNAWIEKQNAVLDRERAQLDRQRDELNQQAAALEADRHQLQAPNLQAPTDAEVDRHNALVRAFNAKLQAHQEAVRSYNQRSQALDERVQQVNAEAAARKQQADAVSREAEARCETHRRWLQDHGPEGLWDELNKLYARLHGSASANGADAACLPGWLADLEALRTEMGKHALRQQGESDQGLLLVEAVIAGKDHRTARAIMIADNSASVASLTPELVQVLAIGDCVGDETDLSLPNGIHVKVPQLVIPGVSVEGGQAQFVKGVVLKASMAGVDGTLGLSFLTRFDFSIQRARPQMLILRPPELPAEGVGFDVFLCHNSEDLPTARRIYEVLTKAGHRPFLSAESLGRLQNADFYSAVNRALEEARHLIVICSSRKHVTSPWVEAEWSLFDGMKRAARKRGNIVPVLCEGMALGDLPLALSRYHAINIEAPNWEVDLLKFLPRT